MKTKAFIFDLDGVIVDTAQYHFLAWQKLAKDIGISFSEKQNEQLKGVSRVHSLEKILGWGNTQVSEDEFNKLMKKKNDDYLTYISEMTSKEILPDVVRVLKFLYKRDQKIALGSASKNARTILKKVQLHNYFEIIVDGTNVSKAKPDPEVFLNAAQGLMVPSESCIVFEDSIAGIEAANVAGMLSIGIGETSVLNDAKYVFKDFTEISNRFLEELIDK